MTLVLNLESSEYLPYLSFSTMRAVVLKGIRSVVVEDRPIPTIQDPRDVIVKVRYTALCGR
jgi:D-arabinose 1-dehydrogenase-like Zn-dependent alcohol dehydrogenase